MTRRQFVEMATATAIVSQTGGVRAADAGGRPNIILMLADDHRWDALGCMGNSVIHTPNLDKLGHDGAIFENHFTTTPICCTSRASIMTGQYAGTHGINDFAKPLNSQQVDGAYWTRLRKAGYRVGFIGKFGVGRTMPGESFDYWRGFPGQGNYYPEGPKGPHMSQVIRGQAMEFIREGAGTQPFCLSISFKSPHVEDQSPRQYLPRPEMMDLYKGVTIPPMSRAPASDSNRMALRVQHSESKHRWGVRFSTDDLYQESVKGYYGLISGIDSVVGDLRKTLQEQGVADNTIIIYSADHGIFLGEHGLAGKWYMYEECTRMPLLVYDPRRPANERGVRRRAMTLNIDLHPTMLELAGLEPAPSVEGRSIVKLLGEDDPEFRSVFFLEHHFPYQGWIPSSEGIRTERWKYIYWTGHNKPYSAYAAPYTATSPTLEELYDLESDPYETRNLINHPEVARQQRALGEYRRKWNGAVHGMAGKSSKWVDPITRANLREDGLLT